VVIQQDMPSRGLTSLQAAEPIRLPQRASWTREYVRRLTLTDSLSVLVAVVAAQVVRFGTDAATLQTSQSDYGYTLVSAVLATAWLIALALSRSHDARIVGSGPEEYGRVARASLSLFGIVAILAFLLKIELARGYLAVALPLGVILLVGSRWIWRRWLVQQRSQGRLISDVLVVGSHHAAASMANTLERSQGAGYRVVGVCVPGWGTGRGDTLKIESHVVPILGDENAVMDALQQTGADTVAVSNTEYLGTEGMRSLAWELEAVDADLVVSPGVIDISGPRLHIRPVAGLPWLHVDKPQYRGANKVGKIAVDLVGASLGLLLLFPLMLAVALAIKLDSRGPALYRAQRIGWNGQPFSMLKFRSMVTGADAQRAALAHLNNGAGPLFKMHNDPRITRVGRWLRRTSIDELPQLFNVLRGQMSIVGPRPPLHNEVLAYTGNVHRRLLVKPGITGLWQVSGRSNLSWEESVRLDLYYVENWSLTQDLIIVWRTFGAVLHSRGAF
jgi:exopolysaccharide biosynthesis polyprenyl glycosylphosphotransferase